jgi:hypothetical protein
MNHYCTYFDRHFLVQGLAMSASLLEHDPSSILWVLSLDAHTADVLRKTSGERIKVVTLDEIEATDRELRTAKSNRNSVEYYFTLSPCWPRYLLGTQPEVKRITYVDADMFFFASLEAVFSEMGAASVLLTEHRYPNHLSHHQRFGRFNVGLLSFRNDAASLACLDRWRTNCLAWCHDRAEDGKYADQKYLDDWPAQLGQALHIVKRRGVNLAPWNWSQYQYSFENGRLHINGDPLEVFHFARFRPTLGNCYFQSGQLEYGIMPWRLRQHVYGCYWRALEKSLALIHHHLPEYMMACSTNRSGHRFWRAFLPRVLFGSDWLRIGPVFISGRLGLGRFSGLLLSYSRRWIRRGQHQAATKREPEPSLTSLSAE